MTTLAKVGMSTLSLSLLAFTKHMIKCGERVYFMASMPWALEVHCISLCVSGLAKPQPHLCGMALEDLARMRLREVV